MKILVLGYFGYVTNQLDGQTIKTRDVYSLLKNNSKEQIDYFDTQTFQESKFNLVMMLILLIKSDVVFYLPANNNLKYIFPLIYIVTKLAKTKINYLVVGGWLSDFLKNKPIHRYMLAKIKGIYSETENVYCSLQKYNFNNTYKLHNFRMVKYPVLDLKSAQKESIKLVFMARVHPLKGVDLLFELDKLLKKTGIHNASIDIYGPLFKPYENEFLSKIENSSVRYCGIIEPADIYDVLQKYDLMLFPTKYYTEGFPGTILDAYISGIPVIATKWLNAEEFIDDGETGYIVEFDNNDEFIKKVIGVLKNPFELDQLKKHVKIKRDDYSADKAWKTLENAIYNE